MHLLNLAVVGFITYTVISSWWRPAFGRPAIVDGFFAPHQEIDHMRADPNMERVGPYAVKK
jgi:hypothetical protein